MPDMTSGSGKVLVDMRAMGRKGGKARVAGMTAKELSASGRRAAAARWAKTKTAKKKVT